MSTTDKNVHSILRVRPLKLKVPSTTVPQDNLHYGLDGMASRVVIGTHLHVCVVGGMDASTFAGQLLDNKNEATCGYITQNTRGMLTGPTPTPISVSSALTSTATTHHSGSSRLAPMEAQRSMRKGRQTCWSTTTRLPRVKTSKTKQEQSIDRDTCLTSK